MPQIYSLTTDESTDVDTGIRQTDYARVFWDFARTERKKPILYSTHERELTAVPDLWWYTTSGVGNVTSLGIVWSAVRDQVVLAYNPLVEDLTRMYKQRPHAIFILNERTNEQYEAVREWIRASDSP